MTCLGVIGATVRSAVNQNANSDACTNSHVAERVETLAAAKQPLANSSAIHVGIKCCGRGNSFTEMRKKVDVLPT